MQPPGPASPFKIGKILDSFSFFLSYFFFFLKNFNYILFKGKIFILLPQHFFPDLCVLDLDLFEIFFPTKSV